MYPLANNGSVPGGVEQSYSMPFIDLTDGTTMTFTNSAGMTPMPSTPGTVTTMLDGQFVRINEACGAINQTGTGPAIDLGSGPGTDCAMAGSAGNTHAARTTYYELNRMKEMARGQLPGDTWSPGC